MDSRPIPYLSMCLKNTPVVMFVFWLTAQREREQDGVGAERKTDQEPGEKVDG